MPNYAKRKRCGRESERCKILRIENWIWCTVNWDEIECEILC